MTGKLFITGASGNIGHEVVNVLRNRQAPCRIGIRPSGERPAMPGIETAIFDFLDASTYRAAVAGCDAVFLLRPPQISNMRTTLKRFIDIARREGVRQIVFISVAGAGRNPIVPHHAVEMHLRSGSPGWTILRPGFFMQNLGDAYRADIRDDDRIYLPARKGRVAFVDTRDLAVIAVDALLDPAAHAGQTYMLTGPEALSFHDVADLLSAEIGRKISYRPASARAYIAHLLRRGLPFAQAFVQTILHLGLRFGQAATVDATLARLLSSPPRKMADYIKDNREFWIAERDK